MDAAGWAAQRNQQIADNALRAIQMLMQGKQYQQERQWQQGQFDYKKDQDRIDNDRQAAQSAALTDYYKSMSARQDQPRAVAQPKWDETPEGYAQRKAIDLKYTKPDKPDKPDKPEKGPDVAGNQGDFLKTAIKSIDDMTKDQQAVYKADVSRDGSGKAQSAARLKTLAQARRALLTMQAKLVTGKPLTEAEWDSAQAIVSAPLAFSMGGQTAPAQSAPVQVQQVGQIPAPANSEGKKFRDKVTGEVRISQGGFLVPIK